MLFAGCFGCILHKPSNKCIERSGAYKARQHKSFIATYFCALAHCLTCRQFLLPCICRDPRHAKNARGASVIFCGPISHIHGYSRIIFIHKNMGKGDVWIVRVRLQEQGTHNEHGDAWRPANVQTELRLRLQGSAVTAVNATYHVIEALTYCTSRRCWRFWRAVLSFAKPMPRGHCTRTGSHPCISAF